MLINKYDVLNERKNDWRHRYFNKEKSILQARDLMLKNGYRFLNTEINFTEGLIETKHLNRMIAKDQIAAIELHKEVLNANKNRLFPAEKLFSETLEIGRKKFLTQKIN